MFIHGRFTRHYSVAPPRPLTFRQLRLKVQTEKQAEWKQVHFVKTSDKLRGEKVLSSDRRWFSRPVWVSFMESRPSLISAHKKTARITLLEAQKNQQNWDVEERKRNVFKLGMQPSCDTMPEVSVGQ